MYKGMWAFDLINSILLVILHKEERQGQSVEEGRQKFILLHQYLMCVLFMFGKIESRKADDYFKYSLTALMAY